MIEEKVVLVLDIGLIHTRVGSNSQEIPQKIVSTPPGLFLDPKFLDQEYFSLYRPYSEEFLKELEEFLHSLLFEDCTEKVEQSVVLVLTNHYSPKYLRTSLEQILLRNFEVEKVLFLSSQFSPIFTSQAGSGIILDFSFAQFSFVPFFKGQVLRQYMSCSKKGGVELVKKLYQSLCKINNGFDLLDFQTRMEFVVEMLVSHVKVPTREEVDAVMKNNQLINKMREKIIKFNNEKKSLYLNYL